MKRADPTTRYREKARFFFTWASSLGKVVFFEGGLGGAVTVAVDGIFVLSQTLEADLGLIVSLLLQPEILGKGTQTLLHLFRQVVVTLEKQPGVAEFVGRNRLEMGTG